MIFKRLVLVIMFFTTFALSANPATASDYSSVTDSAKITQALNMLEKTNSTKTLNAVMGENKSQKPVKIMFYSLISLSPEYANVHALATSDDNGNVYILIDSRHQSAPTEAIACLIAHEVTHQAAVTTMDEEIQAWTNEAEQWSKFKALNPSMNYQGELPERLNKLEALYSTNKIAFEVKNNSFYSQLK